MITPSSSIIRHSIFSLTARPGLLLAAFLFLSVGGCGSGEGPRDGQARSEVERGPVRVCVEVRPAVARLSDRPTMTVSIDYPKGVTVEQPVFPEAIGDFAILDTNKPLPQLKGDREIIRQVLTLEPMRTGKLPIFPVCVTFTDTRPDGDGKQHSVETEELTVEIYSAVGSEVTSLDELHSQSPPVKLPASIWGLSYLAAAAIVLIAAAAFAWWTWKRRRREARQRELTPRELAQLELERLMEGGLAEQDVKLFYVELTGVVRRYIERTTGVRAPEQTTEEFLYQISREQTFPTEKNRRLKNFLEAADLVKFAAHRPRPEDVRESIERAKDFVGYDEQGMTNDELHHSSFVIP